MHESRAINFDKAVATVIAFLLPIRALAVVGSGSLNLGVLAATALAFVLIQPLRQYRGATLMAALATLALVTCPLLASYSASQGRSIDHGAAQGVVIFGFAASVSFAALLWARTHIGGAKTAGMFAAGTIVNAAVTPELWSTNAWKYAFAWPVTVLFLAIAARSQRQLVSIVALGMCTAITALSDYRSFFGFLVFVSIIFVYAKRRPQSKRLSPTLVIAVVFLVVGLYQSVAQLALHGYLGERNQIVTEQQTGKGRSLLASGRPEWNATLPLFERRPIGFGPGVAPLAEDADVAKTGLAEASVDPDSSYVDTYLLGERFELHSVAADLWVNFGLPGLALAVTMFVLLMQAFARAVKSWKPTALEFFLIVVAIWNLLFSPIGSNLAQVVLALAITVELIHPRPNRKNRTAIVAGEFIGPTDNLIPPSPLVHTDGGAVLSHERGPRLPQEPAMRSPAS